MGKCCDICSEERPDILRSNIGFDLCKEPLEDCSNECPVNECDCPVGHITGNCVHYNGCKTFITMIKPGMTFDDIVLRIEMVFDNVDKLFESMKSEIINLQDRVKELEQNKNKEGCSLWEE